MRVERKANSEETAVAVKLAEGMDGRPAPIKVTPAMHELLTGTSKGVGNMIIIRDIDKGEVYINAKK